MEYGAILVWDADVPGEIRARGEFLLAEAGLLGGPDKPVVERLAGGANNMNFVVRCGKSRWVLKMRSEHGAKLASALLDAAIAQQVAARAGVAPMVFATTPEGDFLSEFVDGTTLRPEVFRKRDCIPAVIDALRILHSQPPMERRLDLFCDITLLSNETAELGGRLPEYFEEYRQIGERFQTELDVSNAPSGFLHGDLVPQNMLLSAEGVKFVDFDYCGAGMFAVDIAIAAAQAELDHAGMERMLQFYDPYLDDGQRARSYAIQFINALREISWACAATCKVSESTVLFGDWSYEYHMTMNQELAEQILKRFSPEEIVKAIGHLRPGAKF